jgi:putative MATE family efflux protein
MLVIMGFDVLINLTDTLIAGMLGKQTQAAVGVANQTYFVFTFIVNAVTVGTIAVISRIATSPNKKRELPPAVYTAVYFASVISLVITVIAGVSAPLILKNINLAPQVQSEAVSLAVFYNLGLFFHLMTILFNGILRAVGLISVSMRVMVLTACINIALNFILVFFTPLHFIGIALSTSASWLVAFVLTGAAALRLSGGKSLRRFSKDIMMKVANISWPSAVVMFSWQFSSFAVFYIIAKLPEGSVETMAALTAGLRIESIIFMPAFAFNMANAVTVGNFLGEDKPNEAFNAAFATALCSVAAVTLITACVLLFSSPIAYLLASKDMGGTPNPEVYREIVTYLKIIMLSEPLVAAHLAFGGALAGAGDTKSIMKYTLVSLWVVRIPLVYLLGITFEGGAIGVWWAMNLTFVSQACFSAIRFFSKKWMA